MAKKIVRKVARKSKSVPRPQWNIRPSLEDTELIDRIAALYASRGKRLDRAKIVREGLKALEFLLLADRKDSWKGGGA